MAYIYWFFWLAESVLVAISYTKKGVKFIRPAFTLLTIRNILRLYDFEQLGLGTSMIIMQYVFIIFLQ
jgi:hypothetical protein